MDHHSKRRRLRYADSNADLYEKRARNDLHLKSRFEAIFEKFGKDFSEVGDEIDMQTGKIVVNKGHIVGMAHEQDLGQAVDPSGERLSGHGIAIDDPGGSLMDEDVASSNFESTAESVLGSETDMEDLQSDSAVDLLDRGSSQTAASSYQKLSSRQYHNLKHRRAQIPESDATPLRRLNVDSVLNRLHHRQMAMYDSPIEPAWQVPSLPIDKIAQAQRPMPTSPWSEENERRRSASPNLVSLWTPFPSRGPAKNKAAAMDGRKLTSKMRRSSMPAMITKKAGSSLPKHPISKAARSEAWTFEEESLLRRLRNSTKLTYKQLVPYFPGRSSPAIALYWSRHREYRANNSDPNVVTIAANVEDSDADELQAYDYVFQPSKTVVRPEKIREPSPKAYLSEREVPTSPCPTAQVPFEDFLDSLRDYSRSGSSEVLVHSSPSVTPQTPQESYPAANLHSYQRSISAADPSPVPQAVVAALAESYTGPTSKARNLKERNSVNKPTTALITPARSIDDLSEDELATPVDFPRNANLAKILKGSNKSTAFPKLQSPHVESGSEDELSTPVQQRLVPKKFGRQIGASKRRKSSFS
ncbi:MAG: hypothetical protein HETSPECPRED_008641 [Heterodermia speciosa]|uniref:Myb-like domain-containing protein n=1 Tax=Heterodermia speciosa TaxID=116794 RepID=A0A8H3G260_9LECA|nr:MAG: hypothetical protein HETSPECPRED_008641 [Heterodermia speciosa]